MKLFIALLAFIAFTNGLSTREVWPAGKEFIYEYKARVVAGIPAIKQQLTGFGIKSIVKMQVVSPNTILCKMTELENGKVNSEVPHAAPMVYRGSPEFNWSPIHGDAEEVLKMPFKINLRNGMVTSLEVVEQEPTWSVNIKKGLANQINVNLQQANRIPFKLRNAGKFEDKSFRHLRTPSSENTFFAVEEDAMGGICKTVYIVVPLENFIATKQELDMPREILLEAASEPEMKPYVVTKIRDFDECDRQPSWVHQNMKDITEEPCNPALGMCQKFSTRTSISRYLLRKSSSGNHMRLERVWGENEFIVKPQGRETERLWSVSNQTLVLLSERPISSRINVQSEKMTTTNLRFEFPVSDPETVSDARVNEDPAFQGMRLPHKQSIGETKEKTAEREEEKEKAKSGMREGVFGSSGKYGSGIGEDEDEDEMSRRYGGGRGKYGTRGGKYGSKMGDEEEEEDEFEGLMKGGKYRSRGGKYGSKLGDDEEDEVRSGKYGSKYGSGKRSGSGKYGSGSGAYGSKGMEDYESESRYSKHGKNRKYKRSIGKESSESSSEEERSRRDEEGEAEPNSDYDNEYKSRGMESRGERYYETRAMRSEFVRDLRRYYPSLKRATYYISPHSAGRVVRGSNIKSQIQELMQEVVHEISEFQDLAEKETALKILQVSRACTILSYDELMEVYHRIVSSASSQENAKTKKVLLLDAMVMAGTHPAIMVIRDLVAKGEVRGEMASQVLATIPMSVKVITPELLSELIELVQSPHVKPSNQPGGSHQIWITTLLAIGNMMNFGCVSPRSKTWNYPKEPRGAPLCSKNEPVIVNEFIPMLRQGLERSEGKVWKKVAILHALGNVGHPAAIPILEACITGQICRDPMVRTKAVNALTRVSRIAPSKVYKVLRPVYANQKIHYSIRMAAFQTLIYCKPSPAFFTAVATDTWFEPNQQVASFVYSTLANFANNSLPLFQNITKMARMALPLAKKMELGAQYSKNLLFSDYLPEETIGSYMRTAWFGSTKSVIPRFFFTHIVARSGGLNLDTLQTGFYAQGVQGVINKILRALSPAESKEALFSMFSRISESWQSEEGPLGAIARDLNLKVRKDEPLNVMAWMKVFGGIERLITLDYRTLLELIGDVTPTFSAGKVGLHSKVNFQRAINMHTITVILPTDVGVPVYFSKKTPLLLSVRGHVAFEGDMPSLSKRSMPESIVSTYDLRTVVTHNTLLEMGVICPPTQEAFIAGVNMHSIASLPLKATFKLNVPDMKLSFEMEPASGPLPDRVTLLHAHQRPFTCVKRLDDFQPINKSPTIKYMHVVDQPHMVNRRNATIIGRDLLGMPIRVVSKEDSAFNGVKEWIRRGMDMKPLTAVLFLPIPHSLRAFEHRVSFDYSQLETKRVVGRFSLATSDQESPIYSMEPESSVESRHYKHSSEHYSSTERDLLEFLKNPSQYWDESDVEEKLSYTPIYGSSSSGRILRSSRMSSGMRSSMDEADEMEGDDVEIRTKNVGRATVFHGEVELQGPNPRIYRASVISASTPDSSVQKVSAQLEREGGSHAPWKGFLTALVQFPRLPRTPLREGLLQSEMTSLACVTARWGRNTEHALKAKVIMARTGKQRHIAETSQAAKRCDADEAKGQPFSPSCMRARRQATTLNRYVVELTAENLPKTLWNVTYALDSIIKYNFYPHLTLDPTARNRNSQNKVRIVVNVDSAQKSHPFPVVDVLTKKPHENANFKSVKIHPIIEGLFPLSAKTPLLEKTLNNFLGYKWTPQCRVGEESIITFDNVTVHYPLPQCFHLIAKDCSQPSGISVLAKQGPHGEKIVKIVTVDKEIVVVPTQRTSESHASVTVSINGQTLSNLPVNHAHEISKNGQVVLRIVKRTSGEVSINAPSKGIKVICDGMNVRVEASNMLRGRMCGLCGDFNGEKMAEMKGPRGCVHISPLTFGRSYAVPSHGCSSLPKVTATELLRHLEKKQYVQYERAAEAELTALAARHIQSCNPESYEPEGESVSHSNYRLEKEDLEEEIFGELSQIKSQRRSMMDSSMSGYGGRNAWQSRSESSRPCVRYITKVVQQGDKTCFSVKPVPECNLNCKPSKLISKMMGFHCKSSSELSNLEDLMSSARFGVVEEFLDIASNMSSDLSIPESCELMTV
jgi:hypothetical protein